MKKLFALLGAILSVVYLVSPVDLLPEAVMGPIGLIDDAAVLPILIACLKVLGLDMSRLLGKKPTSKKSDKNEVVDID